MSSPNVSRHASGRLISSNRITALEPGEVFVFGSNAAGRHRGGAAGYAMDHFGAVYGEGHGLHGRSYAIDTMSGLDTLRSEVSRFVDFAEANPELTFLVTEIGTGIAGHLPDQVAPLFMGAPGNVALPPRFIELVFDIDAYSAAWEEELLTLAARLFTSLDATLRDDYPVVSARMMDVWAFWEAEDPAATEAQLRRLLESPDDLHEALHHLDYVRSALSNVVADETLAYLRSVGREELHSHLARAFFEQQMDEQALQALQAAGFEQGSPWWMVQLVWTSQGRLAARQGRSQEALDCFRRVLVPRNDTWHPDYFLRALYEVVTLDTSWLGSRSHRDVVARLALGVAGRITPWRGRWYDARVAAYLRDLAGPDW